MTNRSTPMGDKAARAIVETLQRETAKPARIRLMQLALRVGNLSSAAQDVYRAALAQDGVQA